MQHFTVMITGSRHYTDYKTILAWFHKVEKGYPHLSKTLLHGGARGADTLGAQAAESLGWEVQVFPADWKRYGKQAGTRRNQEMVNQKPNVLIAFPLHNSIGTWDAVRRARAAGIPVRIAEKKEG